MDWNNFQPSIAAAWSPNFKKGFLKTLFGSEGKSTIRGGFRIINDHFGEQLAVSFDGLSTIGFTSASTISANTYNVTTNPAPRFTGFGQNVRALPGVPAPTQRFTTPADESQRIETSLDATITTPTHYTWNVSYGRELPKGMYFEASYVGRVARNLLATRDVMALNNMVDTRSGIGLVYGGRTTARFTRGEYANRTTSANSVFYKFVSKCRSKFSCFLGVILIMLLLIRHKRFIIWFREAVMIFSTGRLFNWHLMMITAALELGAICFSIRNMPLFRHLVRWQNLIITVRYFLSGKDSEKHCRMI